MASLTQIKRLLSLLDHIRGEERYSARELAERLGVSRRTLFRDLKDLAKLGFDVSYDEVAGRYSVSKRSDDGEQTEIPDDELQALLLLGKKLDAASSAEHTPQTVSGTGELPQMIGLRPDSQPGTDDGATYQGLLQAMLNKREVRLAVQARATPLSDNEAADRLLTVHPYRLVFSQGDWYLVANDLAVGRVRCVRMAEIQAVEQTGAGFEIPADEVLDLATEAAWQTDVETGVADEIVVRFDPDVARDVAARNWFRRQNLNWFDDGSLELRTESAVSDRVTAWVLSYGASAEVLRPHVLRDRINEQIRQMCDLRMRKYETHA